MEFRELAEKSQQEIEVLLKETKSELRALAAKARAGQLKAVRDIRKKRVLVAQILTLINQHNHS